MSLQYATRFLDYDLNGNQQTDKQSQQIVEL